MADKDNALGIFDPSLADEGNEPDPFEDEPAGPAEPVQEEAEPETGEAEEEQEEKPAAQAQPQPDRYGPEAYKSLQSAYTKSQLQTQALQQRQGQLEQVVQQMGPMVQELIARTASPEDQEQVELQQYLQNIIDQTVEQRVAPLQQQQEAAAYQQQVVAQMREQQETVQAFAEAHPDIEPDSPEDVALQEVVTGLRLDPTNIESLEIALETVRNPALRLVLQDRPELIDTDETLEYARAQARLLAPQLGLPPAPEGTQGTRTQSAQPQTNTRRAVAHVERGGSGVPNQVPGAAKGDEMDEALSAWKKGRENSVLFGSGGLLSRG